jgi:hypothetical protein
MESEPDILAIVRRLIDDPHVENPNTDKPLPNLHVPNTDILDPHCAIALTDNELPAFTKSNTLKAEPSLT